MLYKLHCRKLHSPKRHIILLLFACVTNFRIRIIPFECVFKSTRKVNQPKWKKKNLSPWTETRAKIFFLCVRLRCMFRGAVFSSWLIISPQKVKSVYLTSMCTISVWMQLYCSIVKICFPCKIQHWKWLKLLSLVQCGFLFILSTIFQCELTFEMQFMC